MELTWFRPRTYPHLDVPVTPKQAEALSSPEAVVGHSWLPLLSYNKVEKRYRREDRKTVLKSRPIMFASHQDSCILARYAEMLNARLEAYYSSAGLGAHVIAYRKLGLSNYHFASTALSFARSNLPCVILCFDVSGFFDNLDHGFLKARLKSILGCSELPEDWFKVLRSVTRHRRIALVDIEAHSILGPRLKRTRQEGKRLQAIATIREVKDAGIPITKNMAGKGIPQGTPISSSLSNLYLLQFDEHMRVACARAGALYQRYSDDIIVICSLDQEERLGNELTSAVAAERLEIKASKTTRALFETEHHEMFQYLGFDMDRERALIRGSSLSRQWRKAKRSIRKTKDIGLEKIRTGTAVKVHTKRLRRRFQPVGARNFSSYVRRAAGVFSSKAMVRQVIRLERMFDNAVREMEAEARNALQERGK